MFDLNNNIDFQLKSIISVPPYGDNSHYDFSGKLNLHQLVYKTNGETKTYFNNKTVSFKKGTVEFLPKLDYADYSVDIEKGGISIDIYFDTNIPIGSEIKVYDFEDNLEIKKLFKKIYQTWHNKESGYYYKCSALFYEIIYEILKKSNQYIPSEKYSKIGPAIEYINAHYTEKDIDFTHLHELCGISYTYLKRLFIEKYGMSPKKYAINLKINYACDLLKTRRFSINEIAEMAGYENVYYFSRAFKKITDICPSKYTEKKNNLG